MTQHVGDLSWREVRVHSHILHVVTSRYNAVVAMGTAGLRDGGRSLSLPPPPHTTRGLKKKQWVPLWIRAITR
jgi:hypothetical protein